MIGVVTCSKVLAAMYGEWATNTDIFDHFVEYHLCPALKSEHVVVLDNISFHHTCGITCICRTSCPFPYFVLLIFSLLLVFLCPP